MPKIKNDDVDRIIFSSRVDKHLVRQLKKIAFDEDRDIYDVLEEALRDYINKKTQARKKKAGGAQKNHE